MISLLIGTLAYGFFLYYDILNLRASRVAKWFFVTGGLLLASSTILIVTDSFDSDFSQSFIRIAFGIIGAVCSLVALIYLLFFALPAKKTYIDGGKRCIVESGAYALCRHPGIWPFSTFYLFLYVILGTWISFAAWVLLTALNIAYSAAQDRWILPKVLNDYANYNKKVPFLIPKFK